MEVVCNFTKTQMLKWIFSSRMAKKIFTTAGGSLARKKLREIKVANFHLSNGAECLNCTGDIFGYFLGLWSTT